MQLMSTTVLTNFAFFLENSTVFLANKRVILIIVFLFFQTPKTSVGRHGGGRQTAQILPLRSFQLIPRAGRRLSPGPDVRPAGRVLCPRVCRRYTAAVADS